MKSPRDNLQVVQRIVSDFGLESLAPRVHALSEGLDVDGAIDVAVLGLVKTGKSALVNSLIGRDLLPVDVLPATAVVTRIACGPVDRAIVRYQSGGTEEAPIAALSDFVTERRNPGNARQVSLVEVETPSLDRFRGVRFVDTPGLGSLSREKSRTSMEWLPRAGAAIVAVSIDHSLGEQDLQLLDELATHTPEIAVALTKADFVSDAEAASIIRFTREQLDGHFRRAIPVFPFSTRPSFEPQREAFREFLVGRVVENRETRVNEIVAHKLAALLSSCREQLAATARAATTDEAAAEELEKLLAREQRDYGQIWNEIRLLADDNKRRIKNAAFERFGSHRGALTGKLQAELRIKTNEWLGNLAEMSAAYKAWLESSLEAEMADLSPQGAKLLTPYLERAQAAISRAVRAFQDRLSQAISKALGVAIDGAEFDGKIEEPPHPDVRVGRTFDIPFDLLWRVIPMSRVRPLVTWHLQGLVPWEVEKNLSRLGAQWANAATRCVDALAKQAQEFIRNEIGVVERLVADTRRRRGAVQDALADLDAIEQAADSPGSPHT